MYQRTIRNKPMQKYVGLDVSMKEPFVCILHEAGKVVRDGKVKTNPLFISGFLNQVGNRFAKVGIESGSLSLWLLKDLIEFQVPTIFIDARKMADALSVQINKTYKIMFEVLLT